MKTTEKLSFKVQINQRKAYQNISKHKRVLTAVVDSSIEVNVNNRKFDEDEVFVANVFFESLLNPGKYPMFTCTCGIFGCGGYYVDVAHRDQYIIWSIEQNPFEGEMSSPSHIFTFLRSDIIRAASELIQELEKLNKLLHENGLAIYYDTNYYKGIVNSLR